MRMSIWVRMSTVLLLVGCGGVVGTAEDQPLGQPLNRPLELASPFVDNLVLQRGMQVPVFWSSDLSIAIPARRTPKLARE